MTTDSAHSWLPLAALLAVASCDGRPRQAPPERGPLPAGVAALVGGDAVDVTTVVRIARTSSVPLRVARDRAIFDALMAAGARQGFGRAAEHYAEKSARARALLESFTAAALAAGPPTDAELAAATQTRWWELDRPPLRRTTHAVVVFKKPEQEEEAHALATRVARAAASATDAASFRALASAVTDPGLTVKVEDLDPVAADGRTVDPARPPPPGAPPSRYSAAFAAATFSVPGLLSQSPVVRTEFGFHVILVTELLPEQRRPAADRRTLLEPEVRLRRATQSEGAALAKGRTVDRVDVERSAPDLTERVKLLP